MFQEQVIITVTGKDKVGIAAQVSSFLTKNDINIQDIKQTLLSGDFTMTMLCSIKIPIDDFKIKMDKLSLELGVAISVQKKTIDKTIYNLK